MNNFYFEFLSNLYGVDIKVNSTHIIINGEKVQVSSNEKEFFQTFVKLLKKYATKNRESLDNLEYDKAVDILNKINQF